MLKMQTVNSPTLASGAFTVQFGDVTYIKNCEDSPATAVTTDSASGQAVVSVSDTTGFAVGQTVLLADSAGNTETGVIGSIVANTSITLTGNLTNSYTVANGSTITAVQPLVSVTFTDPFTSATAFAASWTVSGNEVTVTIDKQDLSSPGAWANAVTSDVAGVAVTIIADGE